MGMALTFGDRFYIGPDGVRSMVPSLASIDKPELPCQVLLRLSTEKGDVVVEEITYRRRPTDPPITPSTIAAAPVLKMVELAMWPEASAAHAGAKIELLRQLGTEWQEDMGDMGDIDPLIADALRRRGPLPDDIAVALRWVEAQDPAKLRRHIRSRRVRRRKLDDRFLAKVARVYTDALAEGKSPTIEVAKRLDRRWNPKLNPVPKTAQRWVRKARDARLLGGTEPRRKGGALLQPNLAE
jgi:hypothetical protein